MLLGNNVVISMIFSLWKMKVKGKLGASRSETCRPVDLSYYPLKQIKKVKVNEAIIDSNATLNYVRALLCCFWDQYGIDVESGKNVLCK